jgi:hypothetical protein
LAGLRLQNLAIRAALLALLSYGMLYFAYKYYTPWLGGSDFNEYYRMYLRPLDYSAADAPFVYRQGSAILTNLLYHAHVYFPEVISFKDAAHDQRIFFAALAANWLSLVGTAIIAGGMLRREEHDEGLAYPLLAGVICLWSFASQAYVVTGLTEGVTWLLTAAILACYLREVGRLAVAALLALSIFQREMIPVMFGALAVFSLLLGRGRRGYQLFVLAASVVAFLAYLGIRAALIPVNGAENQLAPQHLVQSLAGFRLSRAFVFQVVLSQTTVFICLGLAGVLRLRRQQSPALLAPLLLTFLALATIAVAEGVYTNVGRIADITTPAFAVQAAILLRRYDRGPAPRDGSAQPEA